MKNMVDLKYYRKWAKIHPNFMTPHIISVRDHGVFVIELSEGTDFNRNPTYGVTLLKMSGSTFEPVREEGINKVFFSRKDALRHIKNVVEPYIKSYRR